MALHSHHKFAAYSPPIHRGADARKPGADGSPSAGLKEGPLHIGSPGWDTTAKAAMADAWGSGDVLSLGNMGIAGNEDGWSPLYMKDLCPGLPFEVIHAGSDGVLTAEFVATIKRKAADRRLDVGALLAARAVRRGVRGVA